MANAVTTLKPQLNAALQLEPRRLGVAAASIKAMLSRSSGKVRGAFGTIGSVASAVQLSKVIIIDACFSSLLLRAILQ